MRKRSLILLVMVLVLISIVMLYACNTDSQSAPSQDLGTYYLFDGTQLDPDSYIELKSGNKWYDGESEGKFTLKDGKITLFDGDDELMSGTLSNGVLTLDFMGMESVFKKGTPQSSMGSDKVDDKAKITAIQNGTVNGLELGLEIGETIEDVDLSGMITTSKDCSWQLYTSRTATAADAIVTKTIVPKKGTNTYYIVVTSSDGKIDRRYTLVVWKNYYAKLSFYANGEFVSSEDVLTHTTYGEGPSCNVPGYTFNGWGCDGHYVTGDKSFNASLTAKTYKVSFDADGGEVNTSSGIATFDKDFSLPTPRKTGYSFVGWNYNGSTYKNIIHYIFATDIKMTAVWEINSYNVKIKSADTTRGTVNDFDGDMVYGSTVNLKAATNSGYTFIGWYEGGEKISDQLEFITTVPANSVTYTAKWSKISYETNYTQAGSVNDLYGKYKVGDNVTLYATTKQGYTWIGWFDGDTKLTDELSCTVKASEYDKTYTAKWKESDEMSVYSFSSTADTCVIQGVKDKSIVEVSIPQYVTGIDSYAFSGCSGLTSIVIPNSVTSIGSYAFDGCTGLTSITIPDSVTSIGDNAFHGCTGLTTVNWNAIACTSAGSSVYQIFNGCTNLATVNIGENVKTIPSYAFYGCSWLTSITIPDSVTSIGDSAFRDCTGLTSGVTIPDSVTSIGDWTFCGCSGLTSINGSAEMVSVVAEQASPRSFVVNITSGDRIGSDAFRGCSGLTSITIPDSVTSIGEGAFFGCGSLMDIYYTGDVAGWCGISGLGYLMQYGSSSKTLYIGGNKLECELIIPDGVTNIGNFAFANCTKLISVTIPDSVTSIGSDAFRGCSGLTSIIIPDGVTSIGHYAFEKCTGLTSITIPDSVTSIGGGAFYGCSWLTSITIPDSVTSIGGGAFSGCSGLTSIIIPDGVTSIGDSAFHGCTGLTSVTIPESVTSIGYDAFKKCTGLTSITIPDSVTSIGYDAFSGCTGLTSINYSGTKAQWKSTITMGSNWKYNVPSSCKVVCSDGTISI